MPTRPRPSTPTECCGWCSRTFQAKAVGAHRKKFCSNQCRAAYHKATRRYGELAVERGEATVDDLKALPAPAPYTTRPSLKKRLPVGRHRRR